MKKGIGILAFNRPKHLYVALSSIFAAKGIENWFVGVYFDGGLSRKERESGLDVLKTFPIDKVVFYKQNKGILNTTLALMSDILYKEECEMVLFMADDLIMRSDTLTSLSDLIKDDAFIYQLSHHNYQLPGTVTWSTHFNQCGFVMFKESFNILYKWVISNQYLGSVFVDKEHTRPIFMEPNKGAFCDRTIQSFTELYNLPCKFPSLSYVAHFGVTGLNSFNSDVCKQFEEDIFTRRRDTWLNRFTQKWPYTIGTYNSDVEYMLIPNHFTYT